MDPYAKHRFLRSTLAFKYTWWYYGAMVIDPIIRFNWIFYAIYANDTQHSSLVSFFVAFSEVMRRGMWTLFRVENEHCTKCVSLSMTIMQRAKQNIVWAASELLATYHYLTQSLHLRMRTSPTRPRSSPMAHLCLTHRRHCLRNSPVSFDRWRLMQAVPISKRQQARLARRAKDGKQSRLNRR